MIIAIDGPAASGKSTSAKLLADKLKFLYLIVSFKMVTEFGKDLGYTLKE